MIEQEFTMRKQVPSSEGMWLYRLDKSSNTYLIRPFVWLGKGNAEWGECNEEQKAEFEKHNAKVQEEHEKAMEAQR